MVEIEKLINSLNYSIILKKSHLKKILLKTPVLEGKVKKVTINTN